MLSYKLFVTLLVAFGLASQVVATAIAVYDRDITNNLDADATNCAKQQTCANCVADAKCGFNKSTFKCENRGSGQVTTPIGCPLMSQMQKLFPATKGKPAGTIPDDVNDVFKKLEDHIFKGEKNNPDAGRHIKSAWLETHKGAVPTSQNDRTHILGYGSGPSGKSRKTVWDDGFYDRTDIKNMCAISIFLRLANKSARASFVVRTPFSDNACIETFSADKGSCFPLGVNAPKPAPNSACQ